VTDHPSDVEPAADLPNPRMRRREIKDTLLADEPPRTLGLLIAVVAVLLAVAVIIGWSMTYQQTLAVTVDLRADAGQHLHGLAWLPAEQIVQVRDGQRVVVDLQSPMGNSKILGQVVEVSPEAKDGLYEVRIEFPDVQPISALPEQGQFRSGQDTATIFTQKIRVFVRVFSVFRTLYERRN
jgi:hypothetical protein